MRVAGTDRFRPPIVAERAITISGKRDQTKLRLQAVRVRFKAGEEASINLHSRDRSGTAMLTWEADRVLSYRIVTLSNGDNPLAWSVDNRQFPNFTLTATRMWQNECDEARLDIQVERDLRVTVKPAKPSVGPGEPIELDIMTVDQLGRPVAAELSIAMVDRSLLRLFNDRLPEIGSFFYNQTRTGAFATQATNTFRYQPNTAGVPQAVVDEAERAAAMIANAADRNRVLQEAQNQAWAMPARGGVVAGKPQAGAPAAAAPPLPPPRNFFASDAMDPANANQPALSRFADAEGFGEKARPRIPNRTPGVRVTAWGRFVARPARCSIASASSNPPTGTPTS